MFFLFNQRKEHVSDQVVMKKLSMGDNESKRNNKSNGANHTFLQV